MNEHELIPEPNEFVFSDYYYKSMILERNNITISEELICFIDDKDGKEYSRHESWWVIVVDDDDNVFNNIVSVEEEGIMITWEGNVFNLKNCGI